MDANFDKPQRQSSIGVLVMFFDSLQKFGRAFLPLIFIYILKFKELNLVYVILVFTLFLSVAAGIAYLKFRNFTFYIDDKNDEFIINEGIFNKTKTTIKLNKIQQVTINQNLLQRIINIYSLKVDTAGSEKNEAHIKAISNELAQELKSILLENEVKKEFVNSVSNDQIPIEIASPKSLLFLKIKVSSLLKVGITSNYVKSIGLLLTFFFTILENLRNIGKEDLIDENKIQKVVEYYPAVFGLFVFIAVLFATIFLINIVRTLVKFFNYTITNQKGSLLLSYGLINKESTILKPEKVQIVKISSNYFQKKLNVLEVKIKQATNDSDSDKKSQVEIPGCNQTEKEAILKLIFKGQPVKKVTLNSNFRKLVFSIFISIVLPVFIFFIFGQYIYSAWFDYANFVIAYIIFVLTILFFSYRNYKLFIGDNHIIKQSGAWDIQNEIMEINKIQAITTSQLFWHKNLNIGSITVHTAGGNVSFQLGNYAKIKEYVNLWLYEIETSNSNWM